MREFYINIKYKIESNFFTLKRGDLAQLLFSIIYTVTMTIYHIQILDKQVLDLKS